MKKLGDYCVEIILISCLLILIETCTVVSVYDGYLTLIAIPIIVANSIIITVIIFAIRAANTVCEYQDKVKKLNKYEYNWRERLERCSFCEHHTSGGYCLKGNGYVDGKKKCSNYELDNKELDKLISRYESGYDPRKEKREEPKFSGFDFGKGSGFSYKTKENEYSKPKRSSNFVDDLEDVTDSAKGEDYYVSFNRKELNYKDKWK